jgi:glycosyltransferase involved in cell wall biosynthesis
MSEQNIFTNDNMISIIIPFYNAEKYLLCTLDSILSQEELAIEVIAVNDGSTDDSLDILMTRAGNDNRIKVFTQNHKGVSAARNLGIKNSTGKYITFLDADDFSNPAALKKAYEKAEDTDADVVLCNYNWILDNGYTIKKAIDSKLIPVDLPPVFSYHDIPDSIFQIVSNTLSSKLFRRNFIQDIALAEDIINGEDLCFSACVITESAKFTILDDELFNYNRFHGDNTFSQSSVYDDDRVKYLFAFKKILEDADVFHKLIKSYYIKIMSEVNFCITKFASIDDYYLFAGMLRDSGFEALAIDAEGIERYAKKSQQQLYLAIVNETLPPFAIQGRLYETVDKLEIKNVKLSKKVERLRAKNEKLRIRVEKLKINSKRHRLKSEKRRDRIIFLKGRNAILKKRLQNVEKSLAYRIERKLKRIFHKR